MNWHYENGFELTYEFEHWKQVKNWTDG
jgi:hypothetical protein